MLQALHIQPAVAQPQLLQVLERTGADRTREGDGARRLQRQAREVQTAQLGAAPAFEHAAETLDAGRLGGVVREDERVQALVRYGPELRQQRVEALGADAVPAQVQALQALAQRRVVEDARQRRGALVADAVAREVQRRAALDASLLVHADQRLHARAANGIPGQVDALEVGAGARAQLVADDRPVLVGEARGLVRLRRLDFELRQAGEAGRSEAVVERLEGLVADGAVCGSAAATTTTVDGDRLEGALLAVLQNPRLGDGGETADAAVEIRLVQAHQAEVAAVPAALHSPHAFA